VLERKTCWGREKRDESREATGGKGTREFKLSSQEKKERKLKKLHGKGDSRAGFFVGALQMTEKRGSLGKGRRRVPRLG